MIKEFLYGYFQFVRFNCLSLIILFMFCLLFGFQSTIISGDLINDHVVESNICSLQGATIVDQRVCITRWGHFDEEFDFWSRPSGDHEEDGTPAVSVENRQMIFISFFQLLKFAYV